MSNKIKCTCGHSWDKSSSSKKDVHICHLCGKDNTMKNGGWLDAYDDVPQAQVGTMLAPITGDDVAKFFDMFSVPQKAVTKMVTGKYQTPSEAMNIKNPVGAFATDMILDPTNLIGAGIVGKAAKASTKSGALSKAYKYNPLAFKPNPEANYRMLGSKGYDDALESGVIRPPETQYPSTNFENAFYNKGYPLDTRFRDLTGRAGYEGPYMAEVKGNTELFVNDNPYGYTGTMFADPVYYSKQNIPIDKEGVKFYKENWLRGYKEVPKSKKKRDGGWLDKYNNGGPVQPNYNNSNASAGPGFQGNGYSNVGHNYSPAWGGQFQKGGKVITSRKDFSPGILSNVPGLSSLASGNQAGYNRHERYGPLGDLYRYYGGLPLEHDVLIKSQSKPAKSKDKNAEYISLNRDPSFVNEVLDNYKRVSSGKLDKGESKLGDDSWQVSGYSSAGKDAHKTIKQGSEHHSNAIGRYILGKGKDEKGEYISYYDKFDQGTGSGINPGELLGLTKPFEIYDRIYVDPKTGKPKMAMGGSMPGAVGFTYARTQGSAPANDKYTKKTKASAQNGKEMKFYQAGLDFKPKTISQDGSEIPVDPMGYWNPENVGNPVIIPSNEITMEGVDQPLIGISDTGDVQYMYPGEDYTFDGESVTEYPVMQKGGRTPIYTENSKDKRIKAYQDSLSLYNQTLGNLKAFKKYLGWQHDDATLRSSIIKYSPNAIAHMKASSKATEWYASDEENNDPTGTRESTYSTSGYKNKVIPTILPVDYYAPQWSDNAFSRIPRYKKPEQPVVYKKPEPKKEVKKPEPVKKEQAKPVVERRQNIYEGSPVYSPGAGSGLGSALIGFLGQQGDTTYIKPEDYERFAVPKYGKEFIESKTKKKNGGWLDRYN